MFPNIRTDERLTFDAGHGFAHQWIVLVRRGDNFQFSVVQHEPDPAAAKTSESRRLELRLEIIEAAERGLDVVRGCAPFEPERTPTTRSRPSWAAISIRNTSWQAIKKCWIA